MNHIRVKVVTENRCAKNSREQGVLILMLLRLLHMLAPWQAAAFLRSRTTTEALTRIEL
jgi:hypothetical protein